MQSSIAPGETVVLTSGIFGTVSETDDTTLVVEIAPGVNIKVARGAVGSVVRPDEHRRRTRRRRGRHGDRRSTDADDEER